MSPLSLAEIPQIQAVQVSLKRLLSVRRVLALVTDRRLICCWQNRSVWVWRSVDWPTDACRDGLPLQREAMSEALEELLFDSDVVGARLEMLLPLDGVYWRVLQGVGADVFDSQASSVALKDCLDWPLDPLESYVMATPCADAVLAVGVKRTMLQAWIDVVEQADLPLQRVDWIVSCAQRCLHQLNSHWTGDLAWLFPHGSAVRLVLVRNGVPEVDQTFAREGTAPDALIAAIRRSVSAWCALTNDPAPLGWWFSFPESQQQTFLPLIDPGREDCCLNQVLEWNPEPWGDEAGNDPLEPLEQLALFGMLMEKR